MRAACLIVALVAHVAHVALVVACGGTKDGSTDASVDSFDRNALLANIGGAVVIPTLAAIETATQDLSTATTAYCQAIETPGEVDARAAVQAAWRVAMVEVQRSEVMRFGPAAADDNQLRDRLYSWPLNSSCAVDQEVKDYSDAPTTYDISGRLTNRRGMDALEYVLFSANLDHSCPAPVAPAGWNELGDVVRKLARCGYAELAARDVLATSAAIHLGWLGRGGDFLFELSQAGEAGNSFGSAQHALNVVSDALFFVEFEVKDIKVGESAGITENSCGVVARACVEELESQYAIHTKENLVANLSAFEAVWSGGDGIGFDDMLIELGATELAQTMTADIAAMVQVAEAIPGSMSDALSTDYASVAASHQAIKVVTDNLKTQFLTVLGLDIPDNSAGDND